MKHRREGRLHSWSHPREGQANGSTHVGGGGSGGSGGSGSGGSGSGSAAVLIAGAVPWGHYAVGDGEPLAEDQVSPWIAGYVASPEVTELNVVVEVCDDWNLDERWIVASGGGEIPPFRGALPLEFG